MALSYINAWSLRFMWSCITLVSILLSLFALKSVSVTNMIGLSLGFVFLIYESKSPPLLKDRRMTLCRLCVSALACLWGLVPWLWLMHMQATITYSYFIYLFVVIVISGTVWRLINDRSPGYLTHPDAYWIYSLFAFLCACPIMSFKEVLLTFWSPLVVYFTVNVCGYLGVSQKACASKSTS